jgi:hypothetical protein
MQPEEIAAHLRDRIGAAVRHFGSRLPEAFVIAWRGYLAGLLEWGVLDIHAYDDVRPLLPQLDANPVVAILLGREDPTETERPQRPPRPTATAGENGPNAFASSSFSNTPVHLAIR